MNKTLFSKELNRELITNDTPQIKSFFLSLDHMLDGIERMTHNCKSSLNGEHYLTDKELSEHLKICRRTLQDYRDNGLISFYQLGGKIIYRESDIQKLLDKNYQKAYR